VTRRAVPRSVFWAKVMAATTIVLSIAGSVKLVAARGALSTELTEASTAMQPTSIGMWIRAGSAS